MTTPIRYVDALWPEDRWLLGAVRRRVFIEEQQVPEELEWDEFDEVSQHVLALDDHGNAVGCGRLKPDGQIGRMAVDRQRRRQAIGSRLLRKLLDHAEHRGMNQVYLHAQLTAIPFYQKHGFTICSDVFMDAGIPHRTMTLQLEP